MTIDRAIKVLQWFYPNATRLVNVSLADYMTRQGIKAVRHKAIVRRNRQTLAWVCLNPIDNTIVYGINHKADSWQAIGNCKFVELLCTEAGIKYQQYLIMKARGEI